MCIGCGACVSACSQRAVRLVDKIDLGIRPVADSDKCKNCGDCIKVCPGIEITHQPFKKDTLPELSMSWGPVLEVWEGFATDPEIRYKGSSGGAVTALGFYCLDNKEASAVLHIGASSSAPLRNVPVISRNKEDLIQNIGSRYSPAAPCEKFDWIKENGPVVFIGKPCDVVALRKAQVVDPELKKNVSLVISIFCAGTPTTEGTLNILKQLKVKSEDVESFRYRGFGWPGMTCVEIKGDGNRVYTMSYEQSWGDILSKTGQFRCRLCPDATGEFADIACGDPWYRKIETGEQGWSLVLARTQRGRDVVAAAKKYGFIELKHTGFDILPLSQKALLKRRRHLWGRLLMMRMMQVPAPRYKGFSLFKNWLHLPFTEKLRSFAGTFKRIVFRGLTRPMKPVTDGEILNNIKIGELAPGTTEST